MATSSNRHCTDLISLGMEQAEHCSLPSPSGLATPRSENAQRLLRMSGLLERQSVILFSVMRKASALQNEKKSNQAFLPIYSGSDDWQKFRSLQHSEASPVGHTAGMLSKHNQDTDWNGERKQRNVGRHKPAFWSIHRSVLERDIWSEILKISFFKLLDLGQFILPFKPPYMYH